MGAVVHRQETVEVVSKRWRVPVYVAPCDLVSRQHPDFVITSVPRDANAELIITLVKAGCPVLSETPPATDVAGMSKLWQAVGAGRMVQVAEQYLCSRDTRRAGRWLGGGSLGSLLPSRSRRHTTTTPYR